ncbi:MAG: wax ester/triacylglycerol synthase domain-containing protein [Pseudomonadota bacterium]
MRLTSTDASFIYMESASGPMHISSVYVLDGEVAFEKIMFRFERRIHLVPAYRRRLMQVPFGLAHPKWVDDPEFDLRNHVQLYELPPGCSLEEGVNKAVELNEPLMDRSRPLWKMIVLKGVPGKTLLLQMTHHAMIDGASGIELTTILYDLDPNAGEPEPGPPWQPEKLPSAMELINEAVQENIENLRNNNPLQNLTADTTQWEKIRKATEIMTRFVTRPAITAPFNAGLVGPKRHVMWLKKDFGDIREIRRHLGGTINDVVLAVVTEGVARYLADHDERINHQYLRIMCPVSVRTEDQQGALGNRVSAIFPMLPAWPMAASERLAAVVTETERIKQDEEAQALTVMQESLPSTPPMAMAASQLVGTPFDPTALAARVPLPVMPSFGIRPPNPGYNFTCTNVPGVQVPQYMCGAPVTDTIGLLVLTGTTGFSVTILSYNKQLFFNFICEPRLLPDLDVIVAGTDQAFEELLELAREPGLVPPAPSTN